MNLSMFADFRGSRRHQEPDRKVDDKLENGIGISWRKVRRSEDRARNFPK